jgi:hypothetical protein
LISYSANLPFNLETVAYDLCALTELAFDRGALVVDDLLHILLRVDKESEGAVQEQSLRGVRKAQIKLATFFLMREDAARARQVYTDMADEDLARLASIRDELYGVQTAEYWEITDRGTNFDYLPSERKAQLSKFFLWFSDLPERRSAFSSHHPAAPGAAHRAHPLQDSEPDAE